MHDAIKVLMIEDDTFTIECVKSLLSDSPQFQLTFFSAVAPAIERLAGEKFDIILLDLVLPDSAGPETFQKVHSSCPDIPIVVMTNLEDENVALSLMRQGAQDYLIKSGVNTALLVRTIHYALERGSMRKDLRLAREDLERKVNERTRELAESNEQLKQEIEERKKTEADLKAAYVSLKETQAHLMDSEKMEVVGRLASGVAHEVKNPLAIIIQGIEHVYRHIDQHNEQLVKSLGYMSEAVHRADNIIKGMLDFSRVTELQTHPQDVRTVIDDSLLLMQHELAKFNIRLRREWGDEPMVLNIDKNKMEQVFLNLFMNAVDAMAGGGFITIRGYRQKFGAADKCGRRCDDFFRPGETFTVLEIEDTGTGIPEKVMNKVFDPFFTTKQGTGGTGLGLSIVKNIVEMHHGKIMLDNVPSGGLKLTLYFKEG